MRSLVGVLAFLGALASSASSASIEKDYDRDLMRSGRALPVIIPPKRCKAEATDEPLAIPDQLLTIPGIDILEECLLLCSYMSNCGLVQFSPTHTCVLYKEQAPTVGIAKRESRWEDENELARMIRSKLPWYTNIQCDSLEFGPESTTTSTMSTRAPDDRIYFIPGHQCIGKRAGGGYSTQVDHESRILDATRPRTVEDCVNFCFLWGNCTAVIFEVGVKNTCRALHRTIASHDGFKERSSGRGTDALLVYDICCDDEDCRLPKTTTAAFELEQETGEPQYTRPPKVSTAPDGGETEEPAEETEAPEGGSPERPHIVVVTEPNGEPEAKPKNPYASTNLPSRPPIKVYTNEHGEPEDRTEHPYGTGITTRGRIEPSDDEKTTGEPQVDGGEVGPASPTALGEQSLTSRAPIEPDREETKKPKKPKPPKKPPTHPTEEGCFECAYNRTTRFEDFDTGDEDYVSRKFQSASSALECLLACHFRPSECTAIAIVKEACHLILRSSTGGQQLGELFKMPPAFFGYKIKCQMKFNDE